jgi:ABC-2 type transport system permease protein
MSKRLLPIIRKEFIHLIRDIRTLAMMFILPVIMLILFGYAVSFDVNHIPLMVLDRDKSTASREFVSKFTNSGYFELVEDLTSDNDFADRMDSGRAKVIFNIPRDFSRKIAAFKKAEVQVLLDGSDPTWASSALGYINSISEEYYKGLLKAVFARQGLRAAGEPINLRIRVWYNETLRSLNFFIPGLICIILMMMSATLTSLTIVSEKEQGAMEGLVVSPIRKNELILGKVLPYVIVAFADVLMVTAIGVFWFQVPLKGSLLLLSVNSLIFLIGAMGIGIFISTLASSSQEAMQIALLVSLLPSLLLSGFVFPLESMPWLLQGISFLIPARYFLTILRGIFLKGVGLNYLWAEMLFMTALSVLVMTVTVMRFKKRID